MVPLALPFRTALLKNIEHFTHQSLYKIAHPERFFKIIPASSALQQFVSWPGSRPPRPDSDLMHAAAPLQVSCWPIPEPPTASPAGPLTLMSFVKHREHGWNVL